MSAPRAYLFSGVRPSSGAATSETPEASPYFSNPALAEHAAPEDGRTPLNAYPKAFGAGGDDGGIFAATDALAGAAVAAVAREAGDHEDDCAARGRDRSEEHTSELQSRLHLV